MLFILMNAIEIAVDLYNEMQWPWKLNQSWQVSPTHGVDNGSLATYVPSSLYMSPSLHHDWNTGFSDNNGSVVASHDGLLYLISSCSVEINAGRISTYYQHIKIAQNLQNNMKVNQGDIIGQIELRHDEANCLCDSSTSGYSCITSPALNWEVRIDGNPLSLHNMVVGGFRIRAGKYAHDTTCLDPNHCLLATDWLGNPCSTYFVDKDSTIYCPVVNNNDGI